MPPTSPSGWSWDGEKERVLWGSALSALKAGIEWNLSEEDYMAKVNSVGRSVGWGGESLTRVEELWSVNSTTAAVESISWLWAPTHKWQSLPFSSASRRPETLTTANQAGMRYDATTTVTHPSHQHPHHVSWSLLIFAALLSLTSHRIWHLYGKLFISLEKTQYNAHTSRMDIKGWCVCPIMEDSSYLHGHPRFSKNNWNWSNFSAFNCISLCSTASFSILVNLFLALLV